VAEALAAASAAPWLTVDEPGGPHRQWPTAAIPDGAEGWQWVMVTPVGNGVPGRPEAARLAAATGAVWGTPFGGIVGEFGGKFSVLCLQPSANWGNASCAGRT